MDLTKQLMDLGKEVGLTGQALLDFVTERENIAREERARVREDKKRELEILEKQIALESIRKDNANSKGESEQHHSLTKPPKLPHFVEGKDNIDAYLERFERYASNQKWPRSSWAINLGALLQGKALEVYSRLGVDDAHDYSILKEALLKRFQMSAGDFQKKFRTAEPQPGESPRQFVVRLEHYFDRWLDLTSTSRSYDSLKDLVIRQQFLDQCGPGMSVFLKERTPKSVKEITEMAEVYVTAHGGQFKVPRQSHKQSVAGSRPADSRNEMSGSQKPSSNPSSVSNRRPVGPCFLCGKKGHIAKDCWGKTKSHASVGLVGVDSRQGNRQDKRKDKHSEKEINNESDCPTCSCRSTQSNQLESGLFLVTASMESMQSQHRLVNVETKKCPQMCAVCKEKLRSRLPVHDGSVGSHRASVLRDTGCSGVVVRKSLVKAHQMTGKYRQCILIDGTVRWYPTAIVHIHTPFFVGDVEALCMEAPVFDIILGNVQNALPLGSSCNMGSPKPKVDVATETDDSGSRSDVESTQLKVDIASETDVSESRSDLGDPKLKVEVATGNDVSIGDEATEIGMAMQTRAQCKESTKAPRALKVPLSIPNVTPDDIRKAQKEDKTLDKLRTYAGCSPNNDQRSDSHFFIENDLLFRKFEPKSVSSGNTVTQLVVPQPYRKLVMKLAHVGLMGGHQGSKKTYDKVLSNFYWPGVSSDVSRFCQSCDICQRTIPRGRVPRVPLGKMPVIDVPFKRVAVDFRERLETTIDVAQQELRKAMTRSKKYYNRKSRDRQFRPG